MCLVLADECSILSLLTHGCRGQVRVLGDISRIGFHNSISIPLTVYKLLGVVISLVVWLSIDIGQCEHTITNTIHFVHESDMMYK